MQGDSIGVVLNYVAFSKYKIALLDKKCGRIEGILSGFDVHSGALITYNSHHNKSQYFISDIKMQLMPLALARIDMLFLHHVVELVYYFAPVGSCVEGVFDLLMFFYVVEHEWMSMQFKKFFLLKLLTTLGIIPELEHISTSYISQLSQLDVKQFDISLIDYAGEKQLDRWLWSCVYQHPYVSEFKTIQFLSQNRLV